MEGLIVEKAGLLDTIQDQGRSGFQASGIVVSGAMDSFSYQIGNILVGNKPTSPALEITLVGPRLYFSQPTYIAITGANLSPMLNGQTIPMWQAVAVREGDILTFGRAVAGCRSYLAIYGGFDVPNVFQSCSTYVKGKIGGWKGRALQKGDILPYPSTPAIRGQKVPSFRLTQLTKLIYPAEVQPIRVIQGPQTHHFTSKGLQTFFSETYHVSPQMDRMGIRLQGPAIEHLDGADILSEAVPLGGIQVPADGQPIILMSDRQTTGGYTKIACVASIDLSFIAQMQAHHKISFTPIAVEKAQTLYRQQMNLVFILRKLLQQHWTSF